MTLYLYLNDVEEGGGTNFDQLDITVIPKQGRALLWPSVLDSDPNEKDERTTHQALPVGKNSLKYGANVSLFSCKMCCSCMLVLKVDVTHLFAGYPVSGLVPPT